jgi:O-antigen ligase
LLTFSRVAFAGCVVFLAGFFFTVAAHSRRRDISPKALILTAIFLGVGFLFPAIALRHELADRMNISSEEQSVQLRSYYTAVAEGLIVAHPVLGVGVGHFVASYSDGESPLTYFSRSLPAEKAKDLVVDGMSKGWIYQPVHNLYLLIASETGILGIGLFVAVIVSAVGAFIKKRSTTSQADAPERKILYSIGRTMAFFLLLAFLFHGLFDHFFWTSQQGRLMAGFIFGIFFRFV